MRVRGTIIRLEPGLAIVRVPKSAFQCGGASCSGCGICQGETRFDEIRVPAPPADARAGMETELEVTLPDPALAALLVFGLPLAGLVIGVVAGEFAGGTTRAYIAGGLCGLALSIVLLLLLEKRLRRLGMGVRFPDSPERNIP